MKTYFILVLSVAFLLTQYAGFGQGQEEKSDYLGLMIKPEKDKVLLRWLPSTYELWQQGNKEGYDVYRKTLKKNGVSVNESLIKLNDSPVIKWSAERMKDAIYGDKELTGIIFFAGASELEEGFDTLTPYEAVEREKKQKFSYAMAAISANLNVKVSEMGGLFYTDATIEENAVYYYEVRFHNVTENVPIANAGIDLSKEEEIPTPYGLSAIADESTIMLEWKKDYVGFDFAYYNLYRSVSELGPFIRMNESPILGLIKPDAIDKSWVSSRDSVPELGVYYYYKLKGVTPFGDESPASKMVKIMGVKKLKQAPKLTRWEPIDNQKVELEWGMDAVDNPFVKAYIVERAIDPYLPFERLSSELTNGDGKFTDESPLNANYYRIGAVGIGNDTLYSVPTFVMIEDSIPPAPPIGLRGTADTTGLVKISWSANVEPDFLAYRIYRRNIASDDLLRLTSGSITDTFYVDTVDLHINYKNIRYEIHAIDKRFNVSDPSQELVIKRPDITPPLPPVWKTYNVTKEGIVLEWENDYSPDIVKQVLLRKGGRDFNYRPIKVLEGETVRLKKFIDEATDPNTEYDYTFLSYDDAELVSDSAQILRIKSLPKGPGKKVEDLKAITSRPHKTVKLSWDYSENGIARFKIYRKTPTRGLSSYTTVEGQMREFYDKQLKVNSEYGYAVQAVFKDGRKSIISDVIEVKY